ncbi:MAG: TonB-dependent receptor family protein [Chitinophaga sp.]|uniref:outer membrane beta-barrel family protein n=1 Tax=Chitinophaga sp. TaxID=1869181 RepID=UPI0025B8776E|nr:outer membrane beta-barrel family protein [Chitinophaga sp.]MBV8253309.1 TonB-dependent receptor family protein [Chitinophaga sp.]
MHPSAKYDAAGNAGIINLQFKKNKNLGTNGGINTGATFGVYPKYNAGFSLNYRNKKLNSYTNYNVSTGNFDAQNSMLRSITDTVFDQHTNIRVNSRAHHLFTGMDYTINNKKSLGLMITGLLTNKQMWTAANTNIIQRATGLPDKILLGNSESNNKRNSLNANLNYRYTNKGIEWSTDADLGMYNTDGVQVQPNIYIDPHTQTIIDSNIYRIYSPATIHIYSFKTDYEKQYKKTKLGFGAKTAVVQTDNNFRQADVLQEQEIPDSARSNHFRYTENINALYFTWQQRFKDLTLQAGLRAEQTNSKGNSRGFQYQHGSFREYDSTFQLHSLKLFPSLSLAFNKHSKSQWTLNYSYRIDRPAYRDLNPFEFKLDDYTYQKGNIHLKPQYTHSISISWLGFQQLLLVADFSYIKDIFATITDTTQQSRTFITKENLASKHLVSLTASYNHRFHWYEIFINTGAYYAKYQGDYGLGRHVVLDAYTVNCNLRQRFNLGHDWQAELAFSWYSPSIIQAYFHSKGQGSADGGIRKSWSNGKISAGMAVSDIFNTLTTRLSSHFAGQQILTVNKEESRQVRINVAYRFGNNQVKPGRQRKSGLEEEDKRTR